MGLMRALTFRGIEYLVERVERPDDLVLKIEFILRGPRGRSYGLIRTADRPNVFIAVNAHGYWRSTPFDGFRFRVVDDRLVIAGESEKPKR